MYVPCGPRELLSQLHHVCKPMLGSPRWSPFHCGSRAGWWCGALWAVVLTPFFSLPHVLADPNSSLSIVVQAWKLIMSLPTSEATVNQLADGARFTHVVLGGTPLESVSLSWLALYVSSVVAGAGAYPMHASVRGAASPVCP
jgi:hypothetical protein